MVIKPNFMFMHSRHDISTYTDPELVEALVARIDDQGFTNITLVEAQSTYGNYYKNRDVLSVARYVGYPVDKDGYAPDKKYRMVDLTEEMVPYDYGNIPEEQDPFGFLPQIGAGTMSVPPGGTLISGSPLPKIRPIASATIPSP